jgi:hypothetical protein
MELSRFKQLLESKMGNVKPLISENKPVKASPRPVPPPPTSRPLDATNQSTDEIPSTSGPRFLATHDKIKGFDENGKLIDNSEFKHYVVKPEVSVHVNRETVGPYFFRTKYRRGDSGGKENATKVAMYVPSTGEWFDADTNARIATSQRNFSEDDAKKWLRKNGYLKILNPFA